MSNLSIESQVAELCRDALAAVFAESGGENGTAIASLFVENIHVSTLAKRLRTELKAIAGASCHDAIDRGVEALQHAAVWDDYDSGRDAVLSIIRCVTNDEIERASIKFNRAIALELLEVQNG